jgi:phosphoribosyl 1,2-cyclic phosphodiesterase
MKLIVLNSSSSSNGYMLRSEKGEVLLLECGRKLLEVKKKLDFDLSGVMGLILTHVHADHSKYMEQYLGAGIPVYCSEGTRDSFPFKKSKRPIIRQANKAFMIGNFKVVAFCVQHDAPEPFGYIINHKEMGNAVFLTDSYYSKFKFANINHFMVEANYCTSIVHDNIMAGRISPVMLYRLRSSHMSIKTCKQLLKANDLSKVKNIVLIHLSAGNSNAKDFKKQVTELTGKKVTVAEPNIEIDFNLNSF